MPRASTSAPVDEIIDLLAAGTRAGYHPDSLRRLMNSDDPPPMFKRRGKWVVHTSHLDAWLSRRDGEVSA